MTQLYALVDKNKSLIGTTNSISKLPTVTISIWWIRESIYWKFSWIEIELLKTQCQLLPLKWIALDYFFKWLKYYIRLLCFILSEFVRTQGIISYNVHKINKKLYIIVTLPPRFRDILKNEKIFSLFLVLFNCLFKNYKCVYYIRYK